MVGIAASGTTPYVLGALETAKKKGILTGGISCNPHSPLSQLADIAITPVVGPEFVTGSTRMKSGTAQKLVLNMLSTAIMIRLGRVKGNRMVDMQLSNEKLVDRGTKMVMEATGLEEEQANELLLKHHIFTGSSSDKNTLRILPSLAIKKEDLDQFLNAFKMVLSKQFVK